MRVAVLSDLHGNPFALDAVLADLPAVDELVCLGDVPIGPFPTETLTRLRELDCPVAMGNWDEWLLEGVPELPGEVGARLTAQGEWCATQLSDDERRFMRSFRPRLELVLDGTTAVLFHGSPRSTNEVLLPDVPAADLDAALAGAEGDLQVGGHTHLQTLRRRPRSLFANPGSVGLPFSDWPGGAAMRVSPWAEYALVTVDAGGLRLEFRRVEYDVAAAREAARSSGMPHAGWWASCWKLEDQ